MAVKRSLYVLLPLSFILTQGSPGMGQVHWPTLSAQATELTRETKVLTQLIQELEKDPSKISDEEAKGAVARAREKMDQLRRKQEAFDQASRGLSYRSPEQLKIASAYVGSMDALNLLKIRLARYETGELGIRELRSLRTEIGRLRQKISALEDDTRRALQDREPTEQERLALAERLRAAADAGGKLWNRLKATSLRIDTIEYREAQQRRREFSPDLRGMANVAAEEIAGLRDRLFNLRDRLGLDIAKRRDGFSGVGVRPGKLKSLLEMGNPPQPTPESLARNSSWAWAIKDSAAYLLNQNDRPESRKPDPIEENAVKGIKLQRALGLSRTVGDAAGRAQLVHKQTGGTCAICAQQQVISHYGLLPKEADPKKVENALFKQASKYGFFSEGRKEGYTPLAYAGSLLTLYGIPNVEHHDATVKQLTDSVARKKKMVLINVDAGILWNDHKQDDGGHLILVVAAEVGQDKVLGYYINDSATNEGARPISSNLLYRAWRDGRDYIEVQ